MSCRSCGLGPTKVVTPRAKTPPNVNKVKAKGAVEISKKVSVPTRSPARTFNTTGEIKP